METIWKKWRYKNTTFLVLSLAVFFVFVVSSETFLAIIHRVQSWGYLGSFLCGIFFVSVFTVAPASVIIFDLAKILNPFFVAITAGLGAVLGDYLIFRFLRDRVFEELTPVFEKVSGSFWKKLFQSPLFVWLIPILGAFIIASPLPDEVGISLLGLSKVKNWHFILIAFLLNTFGIFIVILLANSF